MEILGAEVVKTLVAAGLPGIFLGWLMFRVEAHLKQVKVALDHNTRLTLILLDEHERSVQGRRTAVNQSVIESTRNYLAGGRSGD